MAVNFLRFQFPCLPAVHCIFQGRTRGESESDDLAGNISYAADQTPAIVSATRQELLGLLEEDGLEAWAECHQVHGTEVLVDPSPTSLTATPDTLPPADGMFSAKPGLGLLIKTADCQPILLAHKSGKYIMAIHSGWRGSRMAFPESAVRRFCALARVSAEDILAVRGPSLGPAHAEFVNFSQEWGEAFAPWFCAENKCMNLWELTRSQLLAAGIKDHNIYELDICTWLNNKQYFSYRRKHDAGRQASIIWIEKCMKQV